MTKSTPLAHTRKLPTTVIRFGIVNELSCGLYATTILSAMYVKEGNDTTDNTLFESTSNTVPMKFNKGTLISVSAMFVSKSNPLPT